MSNPSPPEGHPETTAKDLSKQAFPSAAVEPPSIERTMAGNPAAPPMPSAPPTGTFIQAPGSADSVTKSIQLAPKEISVPADYVVLGELGRGGMGVVYKAKHKRLNRTVALKMILSGSHASHDEHQRFLAEAEAVAALSHPNIVQIFESGQHDGLPYFTLEYVSGGSLGARVKDHPLDAREAARIVEQIARGMDYAHQQGIVHRDLKPENILLQTRNAEPGTRSEKGESTTTLSPNSSDSRAPSSALPKITDFGLAKRVEGGSGLTASGAIMGTPSFMAPEQAKGELKHVGPLSDVYAVGAILYRLIAGRPPFQAATVMDTVIQVLNQEPVPPTQFSPKIPRDLETICLKCLQKEPGKRYQSCGELADDLQRFLDGEPILARPVGRVERFIRWCRRNPGEAVLLASIAVILISATLLSTTLSIRASRNEQEAMKLAKIAQDNETEAKRATEEAKESNRRTEQLAYATRVNLAYREWLAGNAKRASQNLDDCPDVLRGWEWYFLRGLDAVQSVELRGHEQAVFQAEFFLGGRQVATIGKAGTFRYWDAESGIQFDQGPFGVETLAVGPDSKIFAIARGNVVSVGDLETGRKYFEIGLPDAAPSAIQFVQGGKKLASVSRAGKVRFHDAASGRLDFDSPYSLQLSATNAVLNQQIGGNLLAFRPDGKFVAYAGIDSRVRVSKVDTGEVVLDGHEHFGVVERVIYHPSKEIVASSGADGVIRIWDVPGKRVCHELKGHPNFVHALAFSPDGKTLLSGGRDQTVRLWDWENEDQKMVLRGHTSAVLSVGFDVDGRRAISASLDSTARIWDLQPRVYETPETARYYERHHARISARAGTQEHLKFFGHGTSVARMALSPDGKRAATTGMADQSTPEQVVVWDLEGRKELVKLPVTEAMLYSVAFSPDGKSLLVTTSGGGTPDPGVLRLYDTNNWKEKWKWEGPACVELAPAFSPDGKRLVATSQNPGAGKNLLIAWDAADGKELYRKTLDELITRGCFGPGGEEFIFAGIRSQQLFVRDAATGEPRRQWLAAAQPILDVACSRQGILAVATSTGNIDLWDFPRQDRIRVLEGHLEGALSLAFSPGGDRLLSAGLDMTARLWDVSTGFEMLTFRDHQNVVQQVAWSAGGGKLGTIASDGALRVWESPARSAPPETKEWEPLFHDDFASSLLEKNWQPLDQSTWVSGDGVATVRLMESRYEGKPFGIGQARLQGIELPRTFEASFRFKTSEKLSVGAVITDPRSKRSFIATINETIAPHGKPSSYVQQVSTLDGTPRLVPIKRWRVYPHEPSQWHRFRLIRQEETLRLYIDGEEQFVEAISKMDLSKFSLHAAGREGGATVEFADLDIRAPKKAIRDQALRARVGRLFDEIGIKDGVRDALREDTTLTADDRALAESVLGGVVEDPWKLRDQVEVKGGNPNLPERELRLLLRQAEYLEKMDPKEWRFALGLGVARYRNGQFAAAIEALSRSAELYRGETGTPLPQHYAFLSLAHKEAGNSEAARLNFRRMTELITSSDHWADEPWQREKCREALGLVEMKSDPEVEAIRRLVSRSEQDGWVSHRSEAHFAAFDPSFVQHIQAREMPSDADFDLPLDRVKAIRAIQFASPTTEGIWIDFDEINVKVEGERAKMICRETVHFNHGFLAFRVEFDLNRGSGVWKIVRSNFRVLAERTEGTVVIKDEAWWKEQLSEIDKLKAAKEFKPAVRRLNAVLHYREAVELIESLPATELDAEALSLKGEALLELGRVPEAVAAFRDAVARNSAIELPWYFNPIRRQFRLDNGNAVAFGVAWLSDGRTVLGGGGDRVVRLWDVPTGKEIFAFPAEDAGVMSIDVSANGELLAVALQNGGVRVWSLKTRTSVAKWSAHAKQVFRVAFDGAGKRLVTASADGTARTWNSRTGEAIVVVSGHQDEVLSARFSPDGSKIATGSHDWTVRIWDAATGQELKRLDGHGGGVKRVVWSHDGKRIVSCGADQSARVWDTETGKPIRQLGGHSALIEVIDLAGDDSLLATSDVSGTVRLWDAASYKTLRVHRRFNGAVYAARFGPDRKYLATAGRDGVVIYEMNEFPTFEEKK